MPDEQTTPTETPNEGQGESGNGDGTGQTPLTYDTWFEGQETSTQEMISGHIAGLKSALQSEREQRRSFEKQLKEVASQLDEGSKAREDLEKLGADLELSERRATFYEDAHAAGITNLRLAWVATQTDESLIDRYGRIDLVKMKEGYPELFGVTTKVPTAHAGAGTTTTPPADQRSMNDYIRAAAGRGT